MEGTTGIGSDCLSREPRVAQPGERWKLTGRRLFGSKAISDTLAGRAAEEIDFTRLPSATAPRMLEAQVPADLEIHLIVDNYGTHKTALIRKWFAKRPRFHVHFTPTYGSWINLVERWFAELTNKRIRRGVFRSVKELESAIREYIGVHNEDPTPFVWTKTADQILDSIARYAHRTVAVRPS